MCCLFNYHFGLLVHLPPSLWCIFARVFSLKLHVYTNFEGVHSFHLQCVRTNHAPSLSFYACHTLAAHKDISLSSVHNRGQHDTTRPIVWIPTANDLMSNWDFLPGRSPDMLAGPTLSTFLVLEGGPYDKLCPLILFWIFANFSWILSHLSLCYVFRRPNLSASQGSLMISCLNSRMMVKVE